MKKTRTKPYYSLKKVKGLVRNNKMMIEGRASRDAHQNFGWCVDEIRDVYLRLQPKHFAKSDPSYGDPGTMIDVYKARNMMGENIYTHFYVDREAGVLVINSFKELG